MTKSGVFAPIGIIAIIMLLLNPDTLVAQHVDGSWTLQEYETTSDGKLSTRGILIMADGQFGMIYTILSGNGALYGRGHAGGYSIDQDQLTFDVRWSLASLDGSAGITPPGSKVARISVNGDSLDLRFGSGTTQNWRRVISDHASDADEAWRLTELVDRNGAAVESSGLLLHAGERFALIYVVGSDDDTSAVALGGRSSSRFGNRTELATQWSVRFIDGEGHASNTTSADMTFMHPQPGLLQLSGANGEEFRFEQ